MAWQFRGVSSVGRARRSQRRGRGFESLTLHHLNLSGRRHRPAPVVYPAVDFAARPAFAGHILWYQTEPSLTWFPFFRILSLHFGQVPITLSFGK